MKKYLYTITLLGGLVANAAWGQETGFGYQVIIETKGEYNNLDKKSELNPDNQMDIQEVTSATQLYTILDFRHDQEKFSSLLQVEGNFTNRNFTGDSLSFTFQELYTQFTVNDKHFISLGKRRLDWGSGMLWNPTNFYIQKDPFRTQNRLEGIFQVSYSLLFPNGMLQAYVFPEKRLKDFCYALKYDYYGNRIDASLVFLQITRYQQFGFSASYGGDISTFYLEGILRNYAKSYAMDESGKEIAPPENRKRFRTEVVGGASLNFNAHLSFRSEYRFREDHPLVYDPISTGKHTLFASLEWKDLYDRYAVQLRAFSDPVSHQVVVSPLFIWKYHNLQIEASAMIYNNAIRLLDFQGSLLLSYHF